MKKIVLAKKQVPYEYSVPVVTQTTGYTMVPTKVLINNVLIEGPFYVVHNTLYIDQCERI